MATPDEKIVLKIIEEEGGECKMGVLIKRIGLRRDYLRVILESMGHRDLIDFFRDGRSRIADKGWQALGKSPQSKYGSDWPTSEEWWADFNRRKKEEEKKGNSKE